MDHVRRLRNQVGKPLNVGAREFKVRGYVANQLATWDHHEPHLNKPIADALARTSGCFIDVGVNTGQTLMKVLEADPTRAYLGFEPQPGCSYFVQQFLNDNDLSNARVICCGLGETDALVPFYSTGTVDEMGSTIGAPGTVASGAIVVRKGDDALDDLGVRDVGVIKIDVEGAEPQVLNGLRRTFERHRPTCFFEMLPNVRGFAPNMRRVADEVASANKASASAILSFFNGLGYVIHQIAADSSLHVVDAFDLDLKSDYRGRDYMACPTQF